MYSDSSGVTAFFPYKMLVQLATRFPLTLLQVIIQPDIDILSTLSLVCIAADSPSLKKVIKGKIHATK